MSEKWTKEEKAIIRKWMQETFGPMVHTADDKVAQAFAIVSVTETETGLGAGIFRVYSDEDVAAIDAIANLPDETPNRDLVMKAFNETSMAALTLQRIGAPVKELLDDTTTEVLQLHAVADLFAA